MSKKNNENEILKDLYIDSLNLSRLLIRESSKLKLNMNTIYQSGINNYSTKQYEIFIYINNMNCTSIEDIKLRRYLLNIARSYGKALYKKHMNMVDLIYNRRFDEFESYAKKNNFKKRFSIKKFNYIKKLKLSGKSKEIKKNNKYIKKLFHNIFENCEKVIKKDEKLINKYIRDIYDLEFIKKNSKILIDII